MIQHKSIFTVVVTTILFLKRRLNMIQHKSIFRVVVTTICLMAFASCAQADTFEDFRVDLNNATGTNVPNGWNCVAAVNDTTTIYNLTDYNTGLDDAGVTLQITDGFWKSGIVDPITSWSNTEASWVDESVVADVLKDYAMIYGDLGVTAGQVTIGGLDPAKYYQVELLSIRSQPYVGSYRVDDRAGDIVYSDGTVLEGRDSINFNSGTDGVDNSAFMRWDSVAPTAGGEMVIDVSFAAGSNVGFLSGMRITRTTTLPPVKPVLTLNEEFDVPQIGAVTIDGDLSDWSDSTAWSEDFVLWNDNGAPLTSTTKAKFAWNDAGDMLYVAIQTDQANGGHAVVGVGTSIDSVPTSGVGSTQLAFDAGTGNTVDIMNEIDEYNGAPGVFGTDDVVAAQTNDGTTWTYELAIPFWKDWATMSEKQSISPDDEYYVYLVMEDEFGGGNGTDMTYKGNPAFASGAFDVGSALTFKASQIAGDANGDGKVDGSDVTILAGNWQKGVSDGLTATWAEGDFNGDGKVDGSDVTILAGNWQSGVTAAAASVPEPGTITLLLGTMLSIFWIRCRNRRS